MLNFTKGNIETVYVTANENVTFVTSCFHFIFTNKITLEVIDFIASNVSTTKRYDKFAIEINTYFENSTLGFYGYEIYETECPFGGDGQLVETGFMNLQPATQFEPFEYTDQANTFKVYNGE
jgi:hypothetical protein